MELEGIAGNHAEENWEEVWAQAEIASKVAAIRKYSLRQNIFGSPGKFRCVPAGFWM
jgi:hypothetical protein